MKKQELFDILDNAFLEFIENYGFTHIYEFGKKTFINTMGMKAGFNAYLMHMRSDIVVLFNEELQKSHYPLFFLIKEWTEQSEQFKMIQDMREKYNEF